MQILTFLKRSSIAEEPVTRRPDPPIWIATAPGDHLFGARLAQALTERTQNVAGTWQEDESTEKSGRPQARALVFVISPESVACDRCLAELDRAVQNNQRIVPVLSVATEKAQLPPVLLPLRSISFLAHERFADSVDTLVERVESELRVDVFLSYSRNDVGIADQFEKVLWQNGRTVWVDRKKLLAAERWNEAILNAIEAADNFVFLVTESSLSSKYCEQEVNHAASHNKRIIPLLVKPSELSNLPSELGSRQFISFLDESGKIDLNRGLEELVRVLDTNPEWIHAHARLLVKANDWVRHQRRPSYLLRGDDLTAAEGWLRQTPEGPEFQPTELQFEYLKASGRMVRRERRLRWMTAAAAAVILIALIIVGMQAVQYSRINQLRAEANKFGAQAGDAENKNHWLAAQSARRERLGRLEQLAAALPDNAPVKVELANAYAELAKAILMNAGDEAEASRLAQSALDSAATVSKLLQTDSDSYSGFSNLCTDIARALKSPEQQRVALRLRERAFEIDSFLLSTSPKDDDYASSVAVSAHDLAKITKDPKRVLPLEEQGLALRRELAERNPGESPRILELARARGYVGDAYYALDEYESALVAYQESLKVHQSLAAWEDAGKSLKHELSIAHFDIAKTLQVQGKLAAAEAEHRKALEIAVQLGKGEKADTKYVSNEANRQASVDLILVMEGKLSEAVRHRRENVRILKRRADDSPKDLDRQNDLGSALLYLGRDLNWSGDLAGALAEHSAGVQIFEKLTKRPAPRPIYVQFLAWALRWRGDMALVEGKTANAKANYDRSTILVNGLLDNDKENKGFKTDLSTSLQCQAYSNSVLGRLPQAAELYRQAVDLSEKLRTLEPKNPGRAVDSCLVCANLASTRLSQLQVDHGMALYRQASASIAPLVARAPEQLFWQRAWATCEDGLGTSLKYQGRFDEAVPYYRRCAEIRRNLAAKDERNLAWTADAAAAIQRLGYACAFQRSSGNDVELIQQAVDLYGRLHAKNPGNRSYSMNLVLAHSDLADALDFLGRHADAVAQCTTAIPDAEKLLVLDPDNPSWKYNLSWCYQSRGEAQLSMRKFPEALKDLSAARDIRRAISESAPMQPTWKTHLANSERQMALTLLKLGKIEDAIPLADNALAVTKAMNDNPQGGFYPARNYGRSLRVRALIDQARGKTRNAIAMLKESHAIFSRWTAKDPTYLPAQKDLAEDCAALASTIAAAGGPKSEREAAQFREQARALIKGLQPSIGPDADALVDANQVPR